MPIDAIMARPCNSLADHTRRDLIIPWLDATDPLGIIEELSRCLHRRQILGDLFSFYHAAVNHEFLSNSAIPAGIAIPHARSSQVEQLMMAVGRVRRPTVWGGPGARSVDLIFLLAVPACAGQEHLALLSGIARFASERERLDRLRTAADAQAMLNLFAAFREFKTAS